MKTVIAILALGVSLSACHQRPLPQDISKFTTFDIVQKIRCEARDAAQSEVLRLLEGDEELGTADWANDSTRALAASIRNGRKKLGDVTPSQVDAVPIRKLIQKYQFAAVTLNFELGMTEADVANANLKLQDPFSGGNLFTLDVGGESSFTRNAVRNFVVSDTLNGLHRINNQKTGERGLLPGECNRFEKGLKRKGLQPYPITGDVGLAETFQTFFMLSERGALIDPEKKKLATFSETLSFTTTIGGGITPKVVIAPVAQGIAEVGGSFTKTRTDVHKVIVTLSVAKAEPKPKPKTLVVNTPITVTVSPDGRSVIAESGKTVVNVPKETDVEGPAIKSADVVVVAEPDIEKSFGMVAEPGSVQEQNASDATEGANRASLREEYLASDRLIFFRR